MRPTAKMAQTARAALAVHADRPDLREYSEQWMVRFARSVASTKQPATVQRVNDWFVEHSSFRGTPGFFAQEIGTPERLAADLLGGDAGQRWAATLVEEGFQDVEDLSSMVDRLEAEADARAGEFAARSGVGLAAEGGVALNVEDWASPDMFEQLGRRRPEWAGVTVVEGILTDDGRMIREGGLGWRPLPFGLRTQPADIGGHDGAVPVGAYTGLRRVSLAEVEEMTGIRLEAGAPIWTHGVFDSSDDALRAREQMSSGTRLGVSADLVDVQLELPDDPEELERVIMGEAPLVIASGKIAGGTLVDIPAFQDARLQIVGEAVTEATDPEALVASGGRLDGVRLSVVSPVRWFAAEPPEPVRWVAISEMPTGWLPSGDGLHEIDDGMAAEEFRDATGVEVVDLGDGVAYSTEPLVASAGGVRPPSAWFEPQRFDSLSPFTIHDPDPDTGLRRFSGHVGGWGSCHIGFADRCVDVPRGLDYDSFQSERAAGVVRCSDGVEVAAGPFIMDTVHPNLRSKASDAAAFYGHTGCLWGQGRLVEDEFGLQAVGWVLPSVTDDQLAVLDAVDLSPDWRPRATAAGGFGVVAVLAVPVSGFNLGLAASGGPTGEADSGEGWDSVQLLAARKADALAALGRPVPAELAAVAGSSLHPVMRARKEAALAVLAGGCSCGCGGRD